MLADDSAMKPHDVLTHIVCAGKLHVHIDVYTAC